MVVLLALGRLIGSSFYSTDRFQGDHLDVVQRRLNICSGGRQLDAPLWSHLSSAALGSFVLDQPHNSCHRFW